MSVLDDLRSLEQRLTARLAELEPLVEEHRELRALAQRLGIDVDNASAHRDRGGAKPRPAAARGARSVNVTRQRDGRKRPGGTQATGRERRERVLDLIKERPGITVPEIAQETGVDAPSLYRVVRRLLGEGVIRKDGTSLRRT